MTTGGRVFNADGVVEKRITTIGRVVGAACKADERIITPGRCCRSLSRHLDKLLALAAQAQSR